MSDETRDFINRAWEERGNIWKERCLRVEERAERLRAILRDIEWHGSAEEMRCPVCMGEPKYGHDDDCTLAIAIGGKRRTDPTARDTALRD